MKSPFAGINQAVEFETGSYFPYADARYVVEINRVLIKPTRKGFVAFIVELAVLESSNPEVEVGCTKSWLQDMSKESAPSNVKQFALAALGIERDDKEGKASADVEKALDAAVENGAMNGIKLRLETKKILTREKKTPFTMHTWSPCEE